MSLLTILVFLLVISSGSIFCSAFFNKKFEEVLPITCTLIIIISFLFGIIGLLETSVITILIISAVLYVLSIYKMITTNRIKTIINNIFTPGFILFVILSIIIFISIYGKMFDATDEYSHWGDVVKVMTNLNDFGSNPNSNSLFKSYVPATSLFQYFIQKINYIITKQEFVEWLCYFAYDILGISFFMPFCKDFRFNKPISLICFLFVIIMVPLEFYTYAYHGLYVDQLLGYLIALGAVYLLINKQKDIFNDLLILSIIFMLVMTKDAGLAFALLLAISYIIEKIVDSNEKDFSKQNIITIVSTVLTIVVPKVLWEINLKINNVSKPFSNPIDLKNLLFVLIGKDDTYRRKVLTTFVEKMTKFGVNLGETTIFINYFALLIVSIIVVIIISKIAESYYDEFNSKVARYFIIVNTITFIIGTCITYMYKFSEEEALLLASFDRYLAIVFLAMWLYICLSILLISNNETGNNLITGLLICFIVINTPMEATISLISNSYAKNSIVVRNEYNELANKVTNNCDNSNILLIYCDANDRDELALRYLFRPNIIESYWKMDEEEGLLIFDYSSLDSNGMIQKIMIEKIDYVAIYDVNNDFIKEYSNIFESDIIANSLYTYDSKINKLVLYK